MGQAANQALWRFIAPTDPEQKIPVKSDDQDDCLVKVYQDIPADLKATVYIAAAESIIVTQAVAANLKATVTQASDQREVVQDTHGDLKGDAYKPSPAIADLDAIEDTVVEHKVNPDAGTGDNTLTTTPVPTGKIHRITTVTYFNNNTVCSKVLGYVRGGGGATAIFVADDLSPAKNLYHVWDCNIIMKALDYMSWTFEGCTLHDYLVFDVMGYQVDCY